MNFYINLANWHFSEEENVVSFIIGKLSCISKTSCDTNAIFGQKQELKPSRGKMYVLMDICNTNICLVLLQVPKCFVLVQIFWASPKIWLHLVPLQKLLCQHKKQFYWMQIIFCSGTKCLWLAQYVNKFLVRHKKFGLTQNILGPVKGQGISLLLKSILKYAL